MENKRGPQSKKWLWRKERIKKEGKKEKLCWILKNKSNKGTFGKIILVNFFLNQGKYFVGTHARSSFHNYLFTELWEQISILESLTKHIIVTTISYINAINIQIKKHGLPYLHYTLSQYNKWDFLFSTNLSWTTERISLLLDVRWGQWFLERF